jgi:hypothetical protein
LQLNRQPGLFKFDAPLVAFDRFVMNDRTAKDVLRKVNLASYTVVVTEGAIPAVRLVNALPHRPPARLQITAVYASQRNLRCAFGHS